MVDGSSRPDSGGIRAHTPVWVGYAIVIGLQLGLAVLVDMLRPLLPISDYPITFVLITMLAAYVFGAGPAIAAAVAGFALYDYFAINPTHVLWPIAYGREDWAKVGAFVLGEVVVIIAMVQAKKSQRRIQRLADEAIGLNVSLSEQIIEREHAQEALRQSEQRLRATFDNAAVGILEVGSGDRFIAANDRICRILGYSQEELFRMTVHDLTFPEDRPRSDEMNAQLHEGLLDTFVYEKRYMRRDGSPFWAQATVSAIRDDQGRFERGIAVIEDITERKQAEDLLRESEERFRLMANAIPQLSWMAEPDGYIFWYNQRWYEYTGTTPEQMKGWGWQAVHDPEMLPAIVERWKLSLATGEPFEMEFPLLGADGKFRWFLTRGFPLKDSDGHVVRWFGTNTDISDKREAEEEIRRLNAELEQRVVERTAQLQEAISKLDVAFMQERSARSEADAAEARTKSWLELAPDGIVIVTADGVIDFVNTRALGMFGYERDDLLGQHVEMLIPDRYRNVHVIHRTDYIADPRTRQMGTGLELYGLRRDGTEFPVEIALSPSGRNGDLTVTAIVRDITDRKRAEEEINRLNDDLRRRATELEESNRELEAFSYSVSHDLRAPLRAVDGFSNALLKGYPDRLDERGQDYLRRVRAAAQRMAQLIDDILGLSRAGRMEMHPQRVDLSAMVREILDDLRQSQPERKVEAEIEPDLVVTADPHLVRIALDNLLGNAWKFTANRDPARIQLGSVEQNGERVYFIRDNGAGFDPRYADKLFSPFQRLHSEAEFPGTGIGLALVQRIVRRHGGRIWAEGAVDDGATIYFTLPEAET